ncbi:MAG: KAP family P-loop NTPase fold protein [Terriglobia bacterium]
MTAEDTGQKSSLSADRPLTDPALDRLGYAQFAEYMAKAILALPSSEGLVIGLYGAWGAGKTTTLNYVAHFLRKGPAENRPAILRFNPWWFSGREDLVRAFFQQLQAELGGLKYHSRALLDKLGELADLASDVTPRFRLFARLLKRRRKAVPELKQEIAGLLQRQTKRIVVLIDDIDRLTPLEMQEVFRAVKAIADFPNIAYLMAFDKNVVVRSIDDSCAGNGEDYLEKIVQVPFELPIADRAAVHGLLFERLGPILEGVEASRFDKTYWGNVFHDGISVFMRTPRDVVRLTNVLSITFRGVAQEVNPVDFVAVEVLRIFCPEVYDVIRNNRDMFAGAAPTNWRRPTKDELARFQDGWIRQVSASNSDFVEPIRAMLRRLFPKLESVWGNTQYGGPDWEPRWRRELRICSEDIFPVYFSFALPAGAISNVEIRSILSEADDATHFSERLRQLVNQRRRDGKSRLSVFLDRIQDYTGAEIPIDHIEPIVWALFDIGDELIIPGQMGLVGFTEVGNDILMARITWQLLKRVDRDTRFRILAGAFRQGKAIYMMQQAVVVLGQEQGKYPEQGAKPEPTWLVTSERLSELENLVVERIRAVAVTGSLLSCPGLPGVLNFWRYKNDEAEVRKWVSETVTDDANLLAFLERFLQSAGSFSPGDAVAKQHDRLDPNWLLPYLDPTVLVGRVEQLVQSNLVTERQKRALKQFLKEYKFRKSGGNPDSPMGFADLTNDGAG